LDITAVKDDEGSGDNWSYKTCKAPVKSSLSTNEHPAFYRPDALPVTQAKISDSNEGKCVFGGYPGKSLQLIM